MPYNPIRPSQLARSVQGAYTVLIKTIPQIHNLARQLDNLNKIEIQEQLYEIALALQIDVLGPISAAAEQDQRFKKSRGY